MEKTGNIKKLMYIGVTAVLIVSVLAMFTAGARAEESYTFVSKWGSYGTGDGDFYCPMGIAVDNSDNVYVSEWGNDRIQKFDSVGDFITKWGSYGDEDGQFFDPRGIAVDNSDNVYVADCNNWRVQKFDSNGNFIIKWGSWGTGDGQFTPTLGIAVDNSDNVYVSDCADRIQKFDSVGNFITKWGSRGYGDGQFHEPEDVAVDSGGNVYVVDRDNDRIQKFDSVGNFITKWGKTGYTGDGEFYIPRGIAVDNRDNVYVADRNNHRIQKFDSDGNFITKWGKEGIGDGEFYYPHDIAVDSSGNVYVAEEYNHRIQKFAPGIPEPPELSFTQHAPPSSNVATGTPNVLVNTLDFTATGEAIKVDKLNITLYGTGSPADLGDIKIYKETGGDGFDAVADIDISDSETADAWDGSVCTVTLGTDGSNDPQTIEVGDTTGYIVFDIAPTATTGNTVGGKIASGADISAKVDGETIVAQKVGDDPSEVRKVLGIIATTFIPSSNGFTFTNYPIIDVEPIPELVSSSPSRQ